MFISANTEYSKLTIINAQQPLLKPKSIVVCTRNVRFHLAKRRHHSLRELLAPARRSFILWAFQAALAALIYFLTGSNMRPGHLRRGYWPLSVLFHFIPPIFSISPLPSYPHLSRRNSWRQQPAINTTRVDCIFVTNRSHSYQICTLFIGNWLGTF